MEKGYYVFHLGSNMLAFFVESACVTVVLVLKEQLEI